MNLTKKIWALTNTVLELILGLGLIVAITRLYPTDDVGTWFLFISIFALTSGMRDALVQAALVKTTVGVPAEQVNPALKTSLQILFLFEGLITVALLIGSGLVTNANLSPLLLFFPIYSIPNALYRWQIFYLRSKMAARQIVFINTALLLLMCVGLGVVYTLRLPLSFVPIVLGISGLLASMMGWRDIPYRGIWKASSSQEALRVVRHLGLYGMLREGIIAISSRVSLFYSTSIVGVGSTALLGISQRYAQVALLPNNAIQSMLFPALVKEVNEARPEGVQKVFVNALSELLAGTLPLALIGCLVSPLLLTLVNGASYREAWPYLVAYVVMATLITPFGAAFGSLVTALSQPQWAVRIVTVNSVLNMAAGYVLMKWLGLMGAPLALGLTELFGFIWLSVILKKISGISVWSVFRALPLVYQKTYVRLAHSTSVILLHANK